MTNVAKFSRVMIVMAMAIGLSGCLGKAAAQFVKAPEIEDVDFEMGSMDLKSQGFVLKLKMKNPNFFALPLKAINYGITMNGVQVASGTSLDKNIRLGAGQADEVALSLSTNLLKLLGERALFSAVGGGGLNYAVNGNVIVDGIDYAVPFEEKGVMPIRF